MNNSGAGDASGTTYNGSAPRTISHNTIGALALTGGTMTGQLISSYNTNAEPYVNAVFRGVGGVNIGGILVNGATQAHVRFLVGSNTWDGSGAKQWQVRVGNGNSEDNFRVYSWTYGNDILYIDGPSGNVGINSIPDASSKLKVTSTDVHPNVLRLENNNTTINEAGIRMRAINPAGTAFAHADIGVYATGSDTGNFFIKFPFSNSQQTNVRFALNSAGNLMLGTTTATTGFSRLSLVGGEPSGIGPNTGVQLTYNAGTFGGGAITTINAQGGGLAFYTFTGNVGSETYALRLTIGGLGAATFTSSVTATSIIRSGGTSSQFLMADGSVNTSVLPSGAYLPLAGGTLTGTLTISGLGYGNSLVITTNSTNGADIRLTNTGAGGKAYSITSTGSTNALGAGGLQFYNETDGEVAFGYTSARNFVVGTNADAGFKFSVNGTGRFFNALIVGTSTVTTVTQQLSVYGASDTRAEVVSTSNNSAGTYFRVMNGGSIVGQSTIRVSNSGVLEIFCGGASEALRLSISSAGATFTGSVTSSSLVTGSVAANSLVIRNSGVPAAQFYRDLDVTVVGPAGQGIEFGARSGSTFIAGAAIYGGLDNPATTGNLVFQTLTSGNLTTKLTIASSGVATFTGSVDSGGAFYTGGTRSGSMSNIYSSTNNIFYAQSSASGIQAAGTNSVTNGSIVITNTGGTGAYSIIGNAGLSSGYGLFIQSQDRTAALYYPLLLQPNGGNVGIGTVSPQGKLDITGSTSGDLLYLDAAVNTDFAYKVVTGADDALVLRRQHTTQGDLGIMSWTYSGKVGIGTNTPSSLLTITGSNGGTDPYVQLRINATGAYPNNIAGIGFDNSGVQQHIRFLKNGVERFQMRYNNGATEDNRFKFYSFITGNDFVTFNANNDNVGFGTTNPLGSINNNGVQIARGGHTTLLIGDGTSNGGVVQSSDGTRRVFIGANVYDDEVNSWQQFVGSAGYAAFDAIGGDTSALSRILVGSPADSGYGGGNIFFEAYKDNSTSYLRLRTNTDNALFISNAGRTILGSESDNGYKLQVVNGNTWSNGVRIGRDFSITNRATVRLDSNGDEPADILFGRTAAALQTSWDGVFWSLSSRGSGEGNEFRIYRGVANTGGSEIQALRITPSAGAAIFINTVTATAFFESSDKRLKSSILDLDVNVSSIIAKTYLKNGVQEIGYLAQDVESILPSAISKRDDGYLDLSYRQVHTAKIAYLEKRIEELELQLKTKL